MHQCIKFILFWKCTLHVSDGLSVHRQEFKTVHVATGICQTDTAVCLVATRQQHLFDKSVHLVGFAIEIPRNILQREVKLAFSGASCGFYCRNTKKYSSKRS